MSAILEFAVGWERHVCDQIRSHIVKHGAANSFPRAVNARGGAVGNI